MVDSIKLVFHPSGVTPFNGGNDNGGKGSSSTHSQPISLELEDIDFQSDNGPFDGQDGIGVNLLQMGDIDFQPDSSSNCPAHQLGQKKSTGKPDDAVEDFLKDLGSYLMMMQFISLLSRFFGKSQEDDDNSIEKSGGVSPSKSGRVNNDDDLNMEGPSSLKRQKVDNDDDLNTQGPSQSKRKTANSDDDLNTEGASPPKRQKVDNDDDLNTKGPSQSKRKRTSSDDDLKAEGAPPPKRQKVDNDDDVKPSSPSTSGSTSVSGSSPAGPVLPPHKGEAPPVNKPIVVGPGETFDGKNQLFKAGPGLNGGGTAETQDPVFILGPGATLKNVQFEGGDGIHLLGDAKLDNVHAVHGGPDDMITIDGPGNKARDAQLAGISLSSIPDRPANVEITNSSFRHSHDKAIQVNGDANIKLKGVYAEDVGQLLVTLGGKPITAHVSIENSTVKDLRSHLFRLDSVNSTLDIAPDVKTDNGQIQVMMGSPSKASGATRVMSSTDPAR